MQVRRLFSVDEIKGAGGSACSLLNFDPGTFAAHQADAHIVVTGSTGVAARCSVWWTHVPEYAGHRLGVIGHYAAMDEASSSALLRNACELLSEHGCNLAVGPMDGNTWRRYRFVSDFGTEPPFFLEPWNPKEWPGYFCSAGFAPIAEYVSSLNADLLMHDERVDAVEQRLNAAGVRIRSLNPERWDEELRAIYSVSIVSFAQNLFYAPLPEDAFLKQYEKVRKVVRPELVLLAEHEGKLAGYLFGIPDLGEAQRGETVRTVLGKTLAVLPGKTYGGLGALLTDLLHRRSRDLGYQRVIHALQFSGNKVRNMTNRYGPPMRRYTLYSRPLP